MKLGKYTIRGIHIYIIGILILTSRYLFVIYLTGDSQDFWSEAGRFFIFFTPFFDLILNFFFNPLLIPVFDWWKNRRILDNNFGKYDILICFAGLLEIFLRAITWKWFLSSEKPFIDFLVHPYNVLFLIVLTIQIAIFLHSRAVNTPAKKGMIRLLILPVVFYGIALPYGIVSVLFALLDARI